ncbi:hypothetical protein SSX86_000074 [Deinandra increscens subsp. villosa]|uniref:Uncharacterized protein n=1 Tax=Deinandra increscens subsp. villosa TaxID=3103831 RepID=A0AAP0DSP8_9ASTR
MGFGQLLSWKVDGVTAQLAHYVVDKFRPKEMVIKVGSRCLKIDSPSIHKLMGVPMGSKKFYAKKLKKRDPAVDACRKLYPGRFVSPRQLVDHIQSSPDGDTFNFRMDFIICFMSVLVECLSLGCLKEKILKYISSDIDWADINWCEYIIDALRVCKKGWRRMDTTSSFHGPLAILILLYVDSFDCKGMKVDRNQNAITFWTKDNQKRRQKFEMKNGGFGKGKYKGLSNVIDNGSSGIHDLSVGETLSDNVSEVEKNFEIIQNAKEKLDNSLNQLIHMFPHSVEAHSLKERYDSFFKSHMIWTEEDFSVADIPVQSDHNEDELDDIEDDDDMENEHDTERSEEADETDDEDDMENEVEHHKENQADDTEDEDHDENDFDDDDGDHHNEDANDFSNEEADDNEDVNDVGNEEGDYNDEVDDDFTQEGDAFEEMNDDDKISRDVNDVDNEESDDIEDGNDVHNEQGNDNDHVDFTPHGNQSSPNTAHDAIIQNTTDVGSKVSLVQQKSVISQSPPPPSPHLNLNSSPAILDVNNFGDDPSSSHHLNLNSSPPFLEGCSTTFLTNQQDMHCTHGVHPNHIISHVLVDLTADATHNESWEETYLVTPRTLFPTEDVVTTSGNTEELLCDSIVPYTPIHTPKAGIPNSMDGVKHVTLTGPEGEVVVAMQVQPISAVPTLEKVQEVAEQLNSKRINPFRQPPLHSALRSPYFDGGVILETAFTKEEKKLWDIIMKVHPPTPQNMRKNATKNKEKILLNSDLVYYSATHVEAETEIMKSLNYDKILNTRVLDAFVDVLNYDEKKRSDASPFRYFCPPPPTS